MSERINDYLASLRHSPTVVTGFRSPAEVRDFLDRFDGRAPVEIVFVEAPFETRFERAVKRTRADSPASRERMSQKDADQKDMGLSEISAMTGATHIKNDKTKRAYKTAFYSLFKSGLHQSEKMEHSFSSDSIPSLERAIILAMGKVTSNESLTTTQIARLVNTEKVREFKTAKDNVSRYFNQRFHPYFDVQVSKGKARYSLSQTGRSLHTRLSAPDDRAQRRAPTSDGTDQLSLFD